MVARPVVLIVDDEPNVVETLAVALRTQPYIILTATSARSRSSSARAAEPPPAVLWKLPMTGGPACPSTGANFAGHLSNPLSVSIVASASLTSTTPSLPSAARRFPPDIGFSR
jgi:response regulator RpfG family c-di-GMP phosphodiesterase